MTDLLDRVDRNRAYGFETAGHESRADFLEVVMCCLIFT
jgi:hypothetical protein